MKKKKKNRAYTWSKLWIFPQHAFNEPSTEKRKKTQKTGQENHSSDHGQQQLWEKENIILKTSLFSILIENLKTLHNRKNNIEG